MLLERSSFMLDFSTRMLLQALLFFGSGTVSLAYMWGLALDVVLLDIRPDSSSCPGSARRSFGT
jgi:hypothetical protein